MSDHSAAAFMQTGTVPGNADPVGYRAGAFDMPVGFAGQEIRHARSISPGTNTLRASVGSVLVGHSCPLVEMGLLATLRRLTLHDVGTLDELSALPAGRLGTRGIDVVVADRAVAGGLAKFVANLDRCRGHARPKILLIGAGAESSLDRNSAPTPFDACLALECGQRDLADMVNALMSSGTPEMVARPARMPQGGQGFHAKFWGDRPDVPIAEVSDAGEGAHRIEGMAPHEQFDPAARSQPRGGLSPGALRRVREAMERRLAEKLELAELAAVAGVSRCHFARAFKESVGQPPHRYLMMRRIAVAAGLIKDTDRPLTDISLDIGFSDQSHFARVFARITGESPSAYRRRHR